MPTLEQLETLLAELPAGIAYGTAERIEIQRLILMLKSQGQLPDQPADLKQLLAPVLCTSREQQDAFYRAFEGRFGSGETGPTDETNTRRQAKQKEPREWRVFASAAAAILLACVVYRQAPRIVIWFKPTTVIEPASPMPGPAPPVLPEAKTETRAITGEVVSDRGSAVAHADVWIAGKRTTTQENGSFSLDSRPTGSAGQVLVAQPEFRSVIESRKFPTTKPFEISPMKEKPLPAVGTAEAMGEERSLWGFAAGPVAFSSGSDAFALEERNGNLDLFGGTSKTKTKWPDVATGLALDATAQTLGTIEKSNSVGVFKLPGFNVAEDRSTFGCKQIQAIAFGLVHGESLTAVGCSQGRVVIEGARGSVSIAFSVADLVQTLAFRAQPSTLVVAGEKSFWSAPVDVSRTVGSGSAESGLSLGGGSAERWFSVEGNEPITQIDFDPEGHYLMVRHHSGKVDIWDPYGQKVRTPGEWQEKAIGAGFSQGVLKTAGATSWKERLRLLPWVLGALPVPLWLAWISWWRRKRTRLNRVTLMREMSTYALKAPISEPPFRGPLVRKLGQEMRRRKPGIALDLDLEASILDSAQNGGFFQPVYRQRSEHREFLVLVEEKARSGQEERLYSEFARALAAYTFVEVYTFQSSPDSVRDRAGGWIDLQELAARYPSHDLWVITDPAEFVTSKSSIVPEWMRAMHRWYDSALLSPLRVSEPICSLLTSEGIRLGTATVAGMTELLTVLDTAITTTVQHLPDYPRILRRQPLRWVEDMPPDEEDIGTMLPVVEDYLGRHGMLLLRACAVYPETFWQLTLWLANQLVLSSTGTLECDQILMRLTSLPWFREGRLPNWLRARLVNGLGKADEKQVRNLLTQFLEGTESLKGAKQEESEYGIVRREGGQPAKVADYVMFSFLLERKVDEKLAVKPPPQWMRLFFHGGRTIFGPRIWVHLAVAVMLSAGLWLGLRAGIAHAPSHIVVQRWKMPDASRPANSRVFPSAPLRRAIVEVADSFVGKPTPAGWPQDVVRSAAQFATGAAEPPKPVNAATPAPGLVFNDGVMESISGDQAVLIESQNNRVQRILAAIPQRPWLNYDGCVAGKHWRSISSLDSGPIFSIAGTPDADLLLVVGTSGILHRSVDRGAHWSTNDLNGLKVGRSFDRAFVSQDRRHAWIVGDSGALLESSDGGRQWARYVTPYTTALVGVFADSEANRIWAVGQAGLILASMDGRSWTKQDSGTTAKLNTVVGTPDGKTLWVAGDSNTLLLSRDFGAHWTQQSIFHFNGADLNGAFVTSDGKNVFVSDNDGAILVSKDSGAHWTVQKVSWAPIHDITGTPDGSSVWAFGGQTTPNSPSTIFQSSDTGATWQNVLTVKGGGPLFHGFASADGQTVWVGTLNGGLLLSDVSKGCAQPAGLESARAQTPLSKQLPQQEKGTPVQEKP